MNHYGRLHTRVNITPTGFPQKPEYALTVANLHTARLNRHMGEATGGTFTVQLEDRLAQNMSSAYRTGREICMEHICRQLSHLGGGPTTENLRELGMKPEWSITRSSDFIDEVDWAWRSLLPFRKHLPEIYKDWPQPITVNMSQYNDTFLMQGPAQVWPLAQLPGIHPYIVTERVVIDSITQRNAYVNGDECRDYRYLYHAIWVMLHGEGTPAPMQATIPLVRHAKLRGLTGVERDLAIAQAPKISVSELVWITKGVSFYCTDVMHVPYHVLWAYMDAITFLPGADISQVFPNSLQVLHPWPVIDDDDWLAFLKQTKRKAVREQVAQAKAAVKAQTKTKPEKPARVAVKPAAKPAGKKTQPKAVKGKKSVVQKRSR